MIPSSTIERLLTTGSGVSINAADYSVEIIERFALYASKTGAVLVLKNSQIIPTVFLERIALYGKGKVIFEFNS